MACIAPAVPSGQAAVGSVLRGVARKRAICSCLTSLLSHRATSGTVTAQRAEATPREGKGSGWKKDGRDHAEGKEGRKNVPGRW